jgi:outer membrane protein assembly factor BamB
MGSVQVLTNRYGNTRMGANTNETILTTSNVGMLKMLFTQAINGQVYGQPLYISGLTIGGAKHNVVYVATAHNMVYAFDADTMTMPLWSKQLEAPAVTANVAGGCGDMVDPEEGITSTPVIDLNEGQNGTIYVVARTAGASNLHALDLTTGADAMGSPQPMGVGVAQFTPDLQLQRPGLLLQDGVIYAGFGSNCDSGGYHGFVLGHDQHTLMPKYAYNTTPTGTKGAVWQSGMGLAGDGMGGVWEAVANGGGGQAWTVTRLTPSGNTLMVGASHAEPAQGDLDIAAGPVLVGDQVIAGGKSKAFFLINASDGSMATHTAIGGECHNIAAWDGGPAGVFAYTWGDGTSIYQFQIMNKMLVAKGTSPGPMGGHPGGMITISSNGTMPGTGIAWANVPMCGSAWKAKCPGALYAWDATDVTKGSIWHSADMHTYAKYSPPTVANGKAYVATWSGTLVVYGL